MEWVNIKLTAPSCCARVLMGCCALATFPSPKFSLYVGRRGTATAAHWHSHTQQSTDLHWQGQAQVTQGKGHHTDPPPSSLPCPRAHTAPLSQTWHLSLLLGWRCCCCSPLLWFPALFIPSSPHFQVSHQLKHSLPLASKLRLHTLPREKWRAGAAVLPTRLHYFTL